jgi:hypothetical protein
VLVPVQGQHADARLPQTIEGSAPFTLFVSAVVSFRTVARFSSSFLTPTFNIAILLLLRKGCVSMREHEARAGAVYDTSGRTS